MDSNQFYLEKPKKASKTQGMRKTNLTHNTHCQATRCLELFHFRMCPKFVITCTWLSWSPCLNLNQLRQRTLKRSFVWRDTLQAKNQVQSGLISQGSGPITFMKHWMLDPCFQHTFVPTMHVHNPDAMITTLQTKKGQAKDAMIQQLTHSRPPMAKPRIEKSRHYGRPLITWMRNSAFVLTVYSLTDGNNNKDAIIQRLAEEIAHITKESNGKDATIQHLTGENAPVTKGSNGKDTASSVSPSKRQQRCNHPVSNPR